MEIFCSVTFKQYFKNVFVSFCRKLYSDSSLNFKQFAVNGFVDNSSAFEEMAP
jgi:hypothetical protein